MITLTEREEFLADILSTAVEGGINYWAMVAEYSHDVPRQWAGYKPSVVIHNPEEDESPEYFYVDLKLIDEGLQIAKEKYQHFADMIIEAENALDASEIDAEIADVIFQCAIFNEIVYG